MILELAEEAGITVHDTPLAPYDLYTAAECFVTGIGAELIPVREADGRGVDHCPGPIFSRLEAEFSALVKNQTQTLQYTKLCQTAQQRYNPQLQYCYVT